MYTSSWRKVAISIYGPPKEGKVYGSYEVDATELLKFIEKKKKEGIRVTVTHVVTSAVARTLFYDTPEANCFVRRGRLMQREHADVFLAVAREGKSNSGMIIPKAESKTVTELSEYMNKKVKNVKSGKKQSFDLTKSLGKIPWPFRGAVIRFIKWWAFQNGFWLPGIKRRDSAFGSIAITNIGTFGLENGYLALFPIANLPAIIAMGQIKEKPVVVDGKIVIRPMLPLSGTFDHRIMDGDKIGFMTNAMERRLLNPQHLDEPEQITKTKKK